MSDGISDGYQAAQEAEDEKHLDPLKVLSRMFGTLWGTLRALESNIESLLVEQNRERDALAVLVLHGERFAFGPEKARTVVVEKVRGGWEVTRYTGVQDPVLCDSLASALSAVGDFEVNGQKVSSRGLRRVLHYVWRRKNLDKRFNLPWE